MERGRKRPLTILGAGASGLSTAITLARNDIDVQVFEKEAHAGGRFKYDFQCLRTFEKGQSDPLQEFKQLGIMIKPYKKIQRIIRLSRSYSFEVVSAKTPLYYLVSRGKNHTSLDSQLTRQALQYGVDIVYNSNVKHETIDIIATGPPKADSIGYGEIYEDAHIDDTVYVFLDTQYSPHGYLCILPGENPGEAEIMNGTCDPTLDMHTLKSLYERALQDNEVLRRILDGATRKSVQSGIGCYTLVDSPYINSQYYVGEAAGLQDASAFFGIRYAVISGYLAASSILTGTEYARLITQTFGNQLNFERKRSEVFKTVTNERLDKMFQSIVQQFGHELTVEEYDSLRGSGV